MQSRTTSSYCWALQGPYWCLGKDATEALEPLSAAYADLPRHRLVLQKLSSDHLNSVVNIPDHVGPCCCHKGWQRIIKRSFYILGMLRFINFLPFL